MSKVDVRGEFVLPASSATSRDASASRRSARRCCASRPRGRRPSAWPRWSAACSCWWTRRSPTARSTTSCPTSCARARRARRRRRGDLPRRGGRRCRWPPPSGGAAAERSREPVPFGEGFAGRVAAGREPCCVQDPAPAELPYPALEALGIDSLIGVPLLAEGEVTGVLVVGAAAPRHFTADDLNLLRLAADRVALAIDHARVYEREHRIAETLQRSLLPERLPQLPGLSVAARYLPAAAEAEVGGDWYDVLPTPSGGVGLVMGDVAGKGLAAASMVGRLRSALRAYALEGHAPAARGRAAQPAGLDRGGREPDGHADLRRLRPGRRASCTGSTPATRRRCCSSDGDGSRSSSRAAARCRWACCRSRTSRRSRWGSSQGATVVLYTDGLVERPGEHIDDGLERLAEVVRGGRRRARRSSATTARRELVPDGGRARRRGAAGAAHDPDGGPLQRRAADRARGARLDARAAAALAAPRRRQRAGDRRDPDRLRRGGDQRDRARRRRRTPFEISGQRRRSQSRDRGARLRGMAVAAGRRPRAGVYR